MLTDFVAEQRKLRHFKPVHAGDNTTSRAFFRAVFQAISLAGGTIGGQQRKVANLTVGKTLVVLECCSCAKPPTPAKFTRYYSNLHWLKSCIGCVSFGELECRDTNAPNICLLVVSIHLSSGEGIPKIASGTRLEHCEDTNISGYGRATMHEPEKATSKS